jgi:hypothetical protein
MKFKAKTFTRNSNYCKSLYENGWCFVRVHFVILSLSKSKLLYDWQSVGMSWCRAPMWGLRPDITSCWYVASTICCLVSVGCPLWREDGSAICSAITQWSESHRTRNHTLHSHVRLPQPGGPGSRIYISQLYPLAPGSLYVISYDSQGWNAPLYTNITITILDTIRRPGFYLKKIHDISETGFCLRLQGEPTHIDPIHRASLSLNLVRRERETTSFPWAHLSRFHLTTGTESNLWNIVLFRLNKGWWFMSEIVIERKWQWTLADTKRMKRLNSALVRYWLELKNAYKCQLTKTALQ